MISGLKASVIVTTAVYAALGDKDEAFRILEKAIEERNSLLVVLKEDPPFENLHSDPRWKVLLRRMNFPEETGLTGSEDHAQPLVLHNAGTQANGFLVRLRRPT
ncbi:MAG: hypothetical protein L0312_30255 [Acidobacteria bacterium]|nr:hypothetical protein [Acidobacteriota bacterium]